MQDLIKIENLNISHRSNELKDEIIYNYCDEELGGIPFRVINKIYDLDITVFSLNSMDYEDFGLFYGVKKNETLDIIHSNYNNVVSKSYSIYSLLAFGLSNTILDQLISNGFKRLYEVFFVTKEELINKYNFTNSSSDKILNIVDNCGYDLSDFIRFNDFNEYFFTRINDTEYQNSFKTTILDILSNYDYPVSISYLSRQLPHRYDLLNLESFLNVLKNERKIELNNDFIEKYKPSFDEFLNNIPDTKNNYKLFKRYYMEGTTLQALANEEGVTKECIRQKIARVSIPKIKEEEFSYFFENYDLKDDLYNKVFGISYPAIKYLKLTHKKGNKSINDLFDDDNLSDEIRQKVIENMDGMIVINGKKIVANKTELLKYVLKNVCNCETYLTNDILNKHNELAKSISHPELMIDDKYYHSHFVGTRYICLSSRGVEDEAYSGYRYLDKGRSEIKSMITQLNLNDYKDVEINASIIYKANITLMIENDIRDEYELHSVLRYNINNEYIRFGRSPIITFGSGDRDRQIFDLINANSPIKIEELANLLNETYGYNKNSMMSYLGIKFSDFIINGSFDVETVNVDDEIINQLKRHMIKDVYFFEDIIDICERNNIKYSSNIFSKYTLKQLGYTANGSYMYKNDYSSFKAYIETNYFTGDFENLNNVDSRIIRLIVFNAFYLNKIKSLEFIEYKYKEFISIEKLKSYGITRNDIDDFIKSVEKFVDKDLVFTVDYLKNIGFKHKLFTFGFDSIFYDSILFNSDTFKFNRSGVRESVFVNKNSINEPTVANIINQIMGDKTSIKLEELIDLYKKYGKSTNLVTHYYNVIYNTNLKYDAELKSIIKCR
ncbi:MAG: hypothetical protein MR357_05215 [Anaeroplasma sp.]|nr:hypothetical protein [Anaeroplasma sp.]